MKKIKKNNIVTFPTSLSESEREIEAIIFSAAEPLDKKPQLIQHLAAAKLANLPIIICHNKLDLIDKRMAIKRKIDLDNKLKEIGIIPKAIVPTCFSRGYGVEFLLEEIVKHFPISEVDDDEEILFMSNRSFDINKPGTDAMDLKPGIIGGSLLSLSFFVSEIFSELLIILGAFTLLSMHMNRLLNLYRK